MSELTPTQKMCAERIRQKQRYIDYLKYEIDEIAKKFILDFCFLDHSVSTFWGCEKSPIGMCVFNRELWHGALRNTECRYCGDPEERK